MAGRRVEISDPYAVLGVHRMASADEVKAAYRWMVKQWHPDRNPSPAADAGFNRIQKAYALLRDPALRAEVDAELASATAEVQATMGAVARTAERPPSEEEATREMVEEIERLGPVPPPRVRRPPPPDRPAVRAKTRRRRRIGSIVRAAVSSRRNLVVTAAATVLYVLVYYLLRLGGHDWAESAVDAVPVEAFVVGVGAVPVVARREWRQKYDRRY